MKVAIIIRGRGCLVNLASTNQFGHQAPGFDEGIHEFCTLKFGECGINIDHLTAMIPALDEMIGKMGSK